MKIFKNFLIVSLILISNIACKKSEESDISRIASPFTVKYEVTTNNKVYTSFGPLTVAYVNSTGQKQTESVYQITQATPWSKTITITTSTRPLILSLLLSSTPANVYRIVVNGEITQNLYVNDKLVATSTNTGSDNVQVIALEYTIK